jgi:hypothetical protein
VICLSCVAGVEQAPDEEAHRGGAEPLATIFRQSPTRVTDEQTPAPNSTPALSTNAVISAAARGSHTNGNSGIKWPTRMATVIMTAPRQMSAVCTGFPRSGQRPSARQLAKAETSRRLRSAAPTTLRYRHWPS